MTRRARLAVVVWGVLLALPSLAVAAEGGHEMQIDLRSHDGYQVDLSASQTTAILRVTDRKKIGYAETSTDYLTRAVVRGDTVKADFGELGRVSMRFIPSGATPSSFCVGSRRRLVRRNGLYVGSLRFRGEYGYVSVDVQRAGGILLTRVADPHCKAQRPEARRTPSHHPKLTSLYAVHRRGIQSTQFWAETNRRGRVDYEATVESGGEQMATYREAYVEASPLTFATDRALSFLSISPPFPYSGTGLVQRNPDGSRSWSGSLAVSFPGDPDVPLTGPEYQTKFTRQW